jgi:membrane-associated phospholipid phosphatase
MNLTSPSAMDAARRARLQGLRDDQRVAARHPESQSDVPVLEPEDGGFAQRFAETLRGRHPVTVFLLAAVIGYVLLVAASVAFGLLLTKVLLHSGGVASADGRFVAWLVAHRSSSLTEASLIGSIIAGGVVIPTLVGIVAAALACIRRWRVAAFLVTAIAVEAATYRLTTILIHRDRPHVVRLEHLPVNASYPSGHTAAAIAVYCGLALVITSRWSTTWLRVTCWSLALVVPLFVALARMYRGMHHPLDSIAGVLIGVAALLVALFAARAAGFAARTRSASRTGARA